MKIDTTGAVSRQKAMEMIFDKWNIDPKSEVIPLTEAFNRVLVEDVYSVNTLPVVRSSKADGIGVKSENFSNGMPDTSSWVLGVDYVRADTGDDFSDNFDAVIPIEEVTLDEGGKITISDDVTVKKGDNVNPSGNTVRIGQLLAKKETCLKEVHLAVLATGGVEKVKVIKKPKVVYIPTGSELIDPFNKPERGQNIQSNGLMIEALLKGWGAEVISYPIVKDKVNDLEASLEKALKEGDVVLINGGSSKGDEDYNTKLLKNRGVLLQHCVSVGPGRPIGIAIENNIPVINVPGPTIGAFYAMDWCVGPLVSAYLKKPYKIREKVSAKLVSPAFSPGIFEFFIRAKVFKENGEYLVKALAWDVGFPSMMLDANAIFIAPIGKRKYEIGEIVEAELLYGQELIEEI